MEVYLSAIPFFLIASSTGIVISLLFGKQDQFTKLRIAREVFGGFWISAIGYLLLDQLTNLSDVVLFAIASLMAFVNSRIIAIIGRDLMEWIGKGIRRFILNLADRAKKDDNDTDYYQPNNRFE